ncbi:hypothetical protein F0562_014411 [Nyssa sinensis]|uniref:PGG domain-containing protein n=1 Tax=Nyssa sinensis TaxID=561372 RepID=A0A5J4ZND0_9ASTE|nr:hypothetical protein F0562_014411 [Nyssa sinensis]
MALIRAAKHGYNKEMYAALMTGDGGRVIELCRRVPDGPLHILTIHNDTVLHMATYSKQKDLVLELLRELPENHLDKMTCQNDIGNTILHEAATSNRIVPAAMEMLRKAPKLLGIRNKRGETALFRAARYGKIEMFQFLDSEVNRIYGNEGREEVRKAFYQRDDKTTVLHMTILTEFFGVSTKDAIVIQEDQRRCRVPLWDAIRNRKQRYESALRLAKFLIERDTSWEASESAIDRSKPKTHKYGGHSTASQAQQAEGQKASTSQEIGHVEVAETPLFLATKSGILEIVEEILKVYPQAVEHVDDEGRNILHVAIKYRQVHIFDYVATMEIPMMRLVRKTDNNGNSILHMVGMKAVDHAAEEMRSPAMLLQEDLLLFESVEKVTSAHFVKHFNSKGQTAEKLFAINNDKLHLALLIATKYEYLVNERDGDVQSCCSVPLWEAIWKKKQRCKSALRLASFLVERDTSWEATESAMGQSRPKIHKYGGPSFASPGQGDGTSREIPTVNIAETPLFLATKSGCIEIVEEILKTYPQAIEYIDDEGRNILHVAIKYRQIKILDRLEKMRIPMRWLVRKIDDNGNSILHMVGKKAENQWVDDMRSPAVQLRGDLLLYEVSNTLWCSNIL